MLKKRYFSIKLINAPNECVTTGAASSSQIFTFITTPWTLKVKEGNTNLFA